MKTLKISAVIIGVVILLGLSAPSKWLWENRSATIKPTLTELNYLEGVTDSIQKQLNGKVDVANADTVNLSVFQKQVVYTAVQHSHTGNTNETTVFTDTIPANSIGANGSFHITGIVSATNSNDVKYLKIKFNGVQVGLFQVPVNITEGKGYWIVANRNSQSSQVAFNNDASNSYGFTTNTAEISTTSINTAADIVVTLTIDLDDGSRTAAWEYFEILAIKGN